MSQTYSPQDPFDQPAAPSKGMAIAALVCGVLGCIPVVGIVGIVLGIIAISRASGNPTRFGGKGMAIGGIVAGGLTTVMVCAGLVMLPALGQARQAARHAMVQANLRQIGLGIHRYAAANGDALPTGDLQAALVPTYASSFEFTSHDPDQPGNPFTYVDGFGKLSQIASPSQTILVYESNAHPFQHRLAVLYADGSVRDVNSADLPGLLAANGQGGAAPPARPRKGG